MSKIIPFKAVRPSSDKVALVTCRNYDDYSPAELASLLDFNPYSFLHVINPAYANAQKTTLEKRFKAVSNKYQDFKNESVFLQDTKPLFFLHEIQSKDHTFTGIIAGSSVADYKNNVIKKHEDTLQYRVEYFKDYLHQTGFNTEPVLIAYPDDAAINSFIIIKKNTPPIYNFSTTKKEIHTVWKIETETEIEFLEKKFEAINSMYIADGHHRSASSELLLDENKTSNNNNLQYFMSFLIAESQVKIYEFNRIIRDLNGMSKQSFLDKLEHHFIIKNKRHELWKPVNKFEFGMYLDGDFYALFYKQIEKSSSILQVKYLSKYLGPVHRLGWSLFAQQETSVSQSPKRGKFLSNRFASPRSAASPGHQRRRLASRSDSRRIEGPFR